MKLTKPLDQTRRYYVYEHRRATNGGVFYVGKGTGRRFFATYGRSRYWNGVVKKYGLVAIKVAEGLTEAEAFAEEMRRIAFYGRENLCNLSDGGEGNAGKTISAKQREMIRAFHTGKKDKPETIDRKIESSYWRRKRVICLTTGEQFSGLNECAKSMCLSKSKISQVCNGHRRQTGGHIFRFLDA